MNGAAAAGPARDFTAATATRAAFDALGHAVPFGSEVFQEVWTNHYSGCSKSDRWMDIMEGAIQECNSRGVKVPGAFYAHKRHIEEIEIQKRYKAVPN